MQYLVPRHHHIYIYIYIYTFTFMTNKNSPNSIPVNKSYTPWYAAVFIVYTKRKLFQYGGLRLFMWSNKACNKQQSLGMAAFASTENILILDISQLPVDLIEHRMDRHLNHKQHPPVFYDDLWSKMNVKIYLLIRISVTLTQSNSNI